MSNYTRNSYIYIYINNNNKNIYIKKFSYNKKHLHDTLINTGVLFYQSAKNNIRMNFSAFFFYFGIQYHTWADTGKQYTIWYNITWSIFRVCLYEKCVCLTDDRQIFPKDFRRRNCSRAARELKFQKLQSFYKYIIKSLILCRVI